MTGPRQLESRPAVSFGVGAAPARFGVTEKLVWHVVKEFAVEIGVSKLAPHDLRRSCARPCRAAGGELEPIQFLIGHVSVQTTERYLGCTQRIASAVNDRIGIEPKN